MCRCKGYPHYKKVTNVKHSRQAEIVNFPFSRGEFFPDSEKAVHKKSIGIFQCQLQPGLQCSSLLRRIYCLIKRYETRLVLFTAGLFLCCISMKPMAALDQFAKSMTNASLIMAICGAMGFAYVVTHTSCDRHLVSLLAAPLKRLGILLIPGRYCRDLLRQHCYSFCRRLCCCCGCNVHSGYDSRRYPSRCSRCCHFDGYIRFHSFSGYEPQQLRCRHLQDERVDLSLSTLVLASS